MKDTGRQEGSGRTARAKPGTQSCHGGDVRRAWAATGCGGRARDPQVRSLTAGREGEAAVTCSARGLTLLSRRLVGRHPVWSWSILPHLRWWKARLGRLRMEGGGRGGGQRR